MPKVKSKPEKEKKVKKIAKPILKKDLDSKPEKTEDQAIIVKKVKKSARKEIFYAVGRRKLAIARAILILEKGDIIVNGKPLETYFPSNIAKISYVEPFRTTNTIGKWSGKITVSGGGQSAQLQAVILAISRILTKYDTEKFKPLLRKRGFLTRDPRAKERKKPGLMGARKKKQSPKR